MKKKHSFFYNASPRFLETFFKIRKGIEEVQETKEHNSYHSKSSIIY